MDNIISQLISKYNKMTDDYIIQTLSKYHLLTGSKRVYEFLKEKYGDELNIHYNSHLKSDSNIYVVDYSSFDVIKPITLVYVQPDFYYDPKTMTTRGNCGVYLESDGKVL